MALIVQRSDVGEFRRRYRWLILGVLVTFMVLTGRVAQLQLLEGDLYGCADRGGNHVGRHQISDSHIRPPWLEPRPCRGAIIRCLDGEICKDFR